MNLSQFNEQLKDAVYLKAIPEDVFECVLINIEVTSTAKGNPMIIWRLMINNGEFERRSLTHRSPVTERSLDYLFTDMQNMGVQCEDLGLLQTNPLDFVGTVCRVQTVKNGRYLNCQILPKEESVSVSKDAAVPF